MGISHVENRLQRPKYKRKLIEKYSSRRFTINTRPTTKKSKFLKRKKSKHMRKLADAVNFIDIEPPVDLEEPELEIVVDDPFETSSAYCHKNPFDVDAASHFHEEDGTEKWNLVSAKFYGYLLEGIIPKDVGVSQSKKKRKKKLRYSGTSKKRKLDDTDADPYLLQVHDADDEAVDTTVEKMAILVYLGVRRPVFPRIYQNIVTHCGIRNDHANLITDAWAEFSLSTLVTKDEPRIKTIVFPVVDRKLLLDIKNFNNTNALELYEFEVPKEKPIISPINSSSIKLEAAEFDMDHHKQMELRKSPTKHRKSPFLVSNVRSLNSATSSRSQRKRKAINRDYDAICPNQPYYFNQIQRKPTPAPSASTPARPLMISCSRVTNVRGFKSCEVVLDDIRWKPRKKNLNLNGHVADADVEWFDQAVENRSSDIRFPEVQALKEGPPQPKYVRKNVAAPEDDALSSAENNFFGLDQCTRTYGVMIDYSRRNKSSIYLYRMRKCLKFQSNNNRVFRNNKFLRGQNEELNEVGFVDVEESSAKYETVEMGDQNISPNPLKILKIGGTLNKFGGSLLRNANAVTQHTNEIQRVDKDLLRDMTNVKWLIVELNEDVESIKYKCTQVLPASLLFEVMYRADLSKMIVSATLTSADRCALPHFGIYGVPGLCDGVMIGPISLKDRSATVAAAIKKEDGTVEEVDFQIWPANTNVEVVMGDAVTARWWRPESHACIGISRVMNAFLGFHFKSVIDVGETGKAVLKLNHLLLVHNAVTYLSHSGKQGEKNFTLVHDRMVSASMRSEKPKALDVEAEDELIEVDLPPLVKKEDEKSFDYRNKIRMEKKRRLVRNSYFNNNILAPRKLQRQHFVGKKAEEKRVAEKKRRAEFRKNKYYLCWVLDEVPESLSLNACILQAASEIKELELECGELEAKKEQQSQLKNKLGRALIRMRKDMDPDSNAYEKTKFNISSSIGRSSSTPIDLTNFEERNAEELSRLYENNEESATPIKNKSVSAEHRGASAKDENKMKKSVRFENRCAAKLRRQKRNMSATNSSKQICESLELYGEDGGESN